MASPPFNINQALPGDSDIISQHPSNARTFRDVVESWLLVDGNTQGRKDKVGFDYKTDPSGTASVTTVWADSNGYLKFRRGTGDIMYFEEAPGTVKDFAGDTAPNGWLFSYGQAVSRSTYSVLFALLGTTYGIGDGSTTFNLPDLRGRVTAGKDNMGGSSANRLTDLTNGVNGDTLGDTGGLESATLLQANLPNVTLTTTIAAGQGSHVHTIADPSQSAVFAGGGFGGWIPNVQTTSAATLPAMTGTTPTGGSGTAVNVVQPTIVLNKIIKY